MKTTILVTVGCAVVGSIALAQGKPGEAPAPAAKPAMGQTAAKPAATPPATTAAPAAAKPAAAPPATTATPTTMKPASAAPAPAAGAKPAPATAATPAAQPSAAAPEMPKPAPELDAAFKFFDGTWKCETKLPAGAMGPGSPELISKSVVKFKKSLNGFYYQGEYEMKKSKNAAGFKGVMYIGYQAGAKLYTITSSDDMGGAEYATSPGFAGDTIAFSGEGYMMGQKVKVRETMTKKGEKEAGHKFEVDMGKGFQSMGEDTCKR